MGVIRSNNDKGNQLHDEETGEFASKDGAGVSSSAPKEEIPTNEPKLKLKAGADLKNFFEKAKDMNTCAEVPLLKSVEDIDMYVDKFFSKKVCSNIDSLWGRNSRVADFLFLPNPNNPYISLNIFICVLGKNRYKDNHARYIDDIEFKRLEKQVYAYEAIYRGIRYVTREERKKILDGYVSPDVNFFSVYGEQGAFGSNLYTTVNYEYALSFADKKDYNVMRGLLDTRYSKYIQTYDLTRMQNYLRANKELLISIENKTKKQFEKAGIDSERSGKIARSFIRTLTSNDKSIIGVLLGYDYQISNHHQRNILNLGKILIRKENS